MAILTVRNLPDAVHRALRLRAAQHGRSTEAEVRAILTTAVDSPERLKLGSLLHNISREAGLTTGDVVALETSMNEGRDRDPHEPLQFE